MMTLPVRRLAGRLVIELSETLASQVQPREGDVLEAVDIRSGSFSVIAVSEARANQIRLGLAIMEQHAETYEALEAAEQIMVEHKQVLKELAR